MLFTQNLLYSNSFIPSRAINGFQRQKMRKRNSPQPDWEKKVSVPGAFKLDHVQPILFWNFSNILTFILGSPFLLPQRANKWERGILTTPNMDKTERFQCLGHSNWIICCPLSQFCPGKFSTFSISYWGANSYCPRGLIMGVGRISLSQYG